MRSALDRELEGIASGREAATVTKWAKEKLRRAIYKNRVEAFRSCFLDEAGEVTEAGRIVLAHLGKLAGLGVARPYRPAEEVQFHEGARFVVLDVIDSLRLDQDKLLRFAQRIREAKDD